MQDPSSTAAAFAQLNSQFPEHEQLRCPRCDSANTKFCYYNNYNLSQPRHFCKSCRRYWTKGGSLRNIPVGGASRKNTKRSSKQQRSVQIPSASLAGSDSGPGQNPSPKPEPVPILGTSSGVQAGSFTSLLGLASDGQFGSLMEGLGQSGPKSGSSGGPGQNPGLEGSGGSSEGFMMGGLQNGWVSNNGWPDLAIYTPGSKFQ